MHCKKVGKIYWGEVAKRLPDQVNLAVLSHYGSRVTPHRRPQKSFLFQLFAGVENCYFNVLKTGLAESLEAIV